MSAVSDEGGEVFFGITKELAGYLTDAASQEATAEEVVNALAAPEPDEPVLRAIRVLARFGQMVLVLSESTERDNLVRLRRTPGEEPSELPKKMFEG